MSKADNRPAPNSNAFKAKQLKDKTELINVLIGMYGVDHKWFTPYHVRIFVGQRAIDIFPVGQKINYEPLRGHTFQQVKSIENTLESWLQKHTK